MPHPADDPDAGLPRLVRVYIAQSLIGLALGAAFVGLLLAFDVAGLRGLIWRTQGGWLALAMLVVANGLVFAGVQFAIRIMRLADADDQDPGPRLPMPLPLASQPIPAQGSGAGFGTGGGPAATVTGVSFPRA